MANKTSPIRTRFKLWITDDQDEILFGSGRIAMLEAIERTRSLKAAAEELNMSYRSLWGKIKKSEELLGLKLLEKKVGGGSGGSTLTPEAKRLVTDFQALQNGIARQLEKQCRGLFPFTVKTRSKEKAKKRKKGP